MRIEFTTREFQFEHGRAPRGFGYWGFSFEGAYEFWARGTFTEAKKACRAYVREAAPAGYAETVYVNVLP